jgi:excinuclease UvrABC helicase subunit UvrB
MITHTKREMERMAKALNFMEASRLRDELHTLEESLKNKQ